MLAELIKNGFGEKEDLNCAEKILWGANNAYNLGLDREALKLASGFGGGMAIEEYVQNRRVEMQECNIKGSRNIGQDCFERA